MQTRNISRSLLLMFSIFVVGTYHISCVAQVKITFEDGADDYKSVSVFDTWEDSPFMNGTLNGNVKVIDNHLTEPNPLLGYAPNNTGKIVGFQRSRYGSNCYGIRVDLKKSFRLTKNDRYVHVLVNRPVDDSRCLLLTLGKRTERADQSMEVIQNSAVSCTIGKDQWYDVVFLINGSSDEYNVDPNNGIDIYSLVIVPDLQSRSEITEDFACYIDEIEINDNADTRFSVEEYQKCVGDGTTPVRFDHPLHAVGIKYENDGTQLVDGLGTYVYERHMESPLNVSPGELVQPVFVYDGSGIQGYVYVDWGRDGVFNYDIDENFKPTVQSDMMSYDGYIGFGYWLKSDGSQSTGSVTYESMPKFRIPENALGYYPIRFKLDGNNINPASRTSFPSVVDYGGWMVDALLNVHSNICVVNASQLNGDFYTTDGTLLHNYSCPSGQPFKIKVSPAPGFTHRGCKVRYGYNLSGDSLIYGVPQYFEEYFTYDQFENGEYLTLPQYIMSAGNVEVEGFMIDKDTPSPMYVEQVKDNRNRGEIDDVYSVSGIKLDDTKDRKGVYLKSGNKFINKK